MDLEHKQQPLVSLLRALVLGPNLPALGSNLPALGSNRPQVLGPSQPPVSEPHLSEHLLLSLHLEHLLLHLPLEHQQLQLVSE